MSKIDEILDKYVANYDLEQLAFRQSGQETVKAELLQLVLDEIIGKDDPFNEKLYNEYRSVLGEDSKECQEMKAAQQANIARDYFRQKAIKLFGVEDEPR